MQFLCIYFSIELKIGGCKTNVLPQTKRPGVRVSSVSLWLLLIVTTLSICWLKFLSLDNVVFCLLVEQPCFRACQRPRCNTCNYISSHSRWYAALSRFWIRDHSYFFTLDKLNCTRLSDSGERYAKCWRKKEKGTAAPAILHIFPVDSAIHLKSE